MGKIINFNDSPVNELKKELKKKDDELERIHAELAYFKRIYSTTVSIGDLLKLQVADIHSNISLLQNHLAMVQDILQNVKNKIDQLEKMKARIKTTPPPQQ